jgi:hypothetical protein
LVIEYLTPYLPALGGDYPLPESAALVASAIRLHALARQIKEPSPAKNGVEKQPHSRNRFTEMVKPSVANDNAESDSIEWYNNPKLREAAMVTLCQAADAARGHDDTSIALTDAEFLAAQNIIATKVHEVEGTLRQSQPKAPSSQRG